MTHLNDAQIGSRKAINMNTDKYQYIVERSKENVREFRSGLQSIILAPPRKGNIVMFHLGRSGSTVLARMLSDHRKIFWVGEIYNLPIRFGKYTTTNPILRLDKKMRFVPNEFFGFEVKPFHLELLGISLAQFVDALRCRDFSHFVLLERRNYLRKIISSVILHQYGKRHENSASPTLTKVFLNIDCIEIDRQRKTLLGFLEKFDKDIKEVKRACERDTLLEIVYEDHIFGDPFVGYKRMCDFLSLTPEQTSIRISKTNPFPIHEMVINFEEVEKTLRGTAYEWMVYA